MNRGLAWALIGTAGALAAWQGALALQNEAEAPDPAPKAERPAQPAEPVQPKAAERAAPAVPPARRKIAGETPMAQRVAVIGLLNKRNGIAREITLRPGQAVRVGDVVIRLRACEAAAPWEDQKLTGAFVQTDVRGRDDKWRRIFSGWLFKESPSLNTVQHPIYDVWPKSCVMRWPEIGPDTEIVSEPASSRSNAKKSGGAAAAPAATPSASSSNET